MAAADKAGKDTDKEKSVDKSKSYESGGTAFVGCIILGTGIGFAIDHVAAGAMIGVGVGFIVMSIFKAVGK